MLNNLKITIITVCLNAERYIENSIKSAISQTYKNIEYIIIDGQSTDQTLSIIEKYKSQISKVISEKDRGIFDAMNKGIQLSTGDVIYFLNADDRLYNTKVLQNVANAFSQHPNADMVYGKAFPLHLPKIRNLNHHQAMIGEIQTNHDAMTKCIVHQRMFTKKRLFTKYGLFDASYKICADTNWFVSCFYKGLNMAFIDLYVVYYDTRGISNRHKKTFIKEKVSFLFLNVPFNDFLAYFLYAILRNLKKDPQNTKFDWDKLDNQIKTTNESN